MSAECDLCLRRRGAVNLFEQVHLCPKCLDDVGRWWRDNRAHTVDLVISQEELGERGEAFYDVRAVVGFGELLPADDVQAEVITRLARCGLAVVVSHGSSVQLLTHSNGGRGMFLTGVGASRVPKRGTIRVARRKS